MADMARKLVRAGHMYCDDTDVETMREERGNSVESKRRGMAPQEAERLFDEMLKGSEVRAYVHRCVRACIRACVRACLCSDQAQLFCAVPVFPSPLGGKNRTPPAPARTFSTRCWSARSQWCLGALRSARVS